MSKAQTICSWCHETTTKSPCSHCDRDPELDGRWRLIESLGAGAAGQTWLAESTQDKRKVAIKELTYRRLADFKQLELFEREAKVLETLKHPGIPKYFEDFVVEEGRHVSFYLVQERIDGKVLTGQTPTDEKSVLEMMRELVQVLDYLASRRPPVIHRDIKPSNIMRRKDGSYVLIDFGTTRAAIDQTLGQSTVAGTLGYMAPEQLLGRATSASDVYGLAATAVALLAAKDASELIDPHRPNQWRKHVKVSQGLADLLERMLRVDEVERYCDLSEIANEIDKLLLGGEGPITSRSNTQSPADLPLLRPKKRKGESIREGLIEFSRDPFDILLVSTLGQAGIYSYLLIVVISAVMKNMTGEFPGFLNASLLWQVPLLVVLVHILAFAAGMAFDPDRDNPESTLTRFRPIRRFVRQLFRDSHIAFRVFSLFILGAVLTGPVVGVFGAFGLNPQWALIFPAIVLLDQIQAILRRRTRWMRVLADEYEDVWPKGSKQREAFVEMANKLWCAMPGWGTKPGPLANFKENYQAMVKLREHPSFDSRQREHVDLILLTSTNQPEDVLERVRAMEPRKATVATLKARFDYGGRDDEKTTFELVNAYSDHLRRGE